MYVENRKNVFLKIFLINKGQIYHMRLRISMEFLDERLIVHLKNPRIIKLDNNQLDLRII